MKLYRIAFSILAAACIFAGCQNMEELLNNAPMIATDKGVYDAPKAGGDVTIKFKASTDWTATVLPASSRDKIDDVTLTPESGKASSEVQEIKVTFAANKGNDRAATLQILGEGLSAAVTINQPGDEGEFIGEKITCKEFLEKPVDPTVWYILEGKVTKIEKGGAAEDAYSNFYINDGSITDGDGAYIYGLYDGKGGSQFKTAPAWLYANGVKVGYNMKVCTTRGQYGTTIEGVNTYVLDFSAPVEPVLTCDKKSVKVYAVSTSASFDITAENLSGKWTVTATGAEWVTSFTQEGEGSGKLNVSFPANTAPEAKTATFTVSAAGVDPITLTLTQAAYQVSTIKEVLEGANGTYTVVDAFVVAVGNTNTVFSDGTGVIFAYEKGKKSKVGDKVRIDGDVTLYNGVKEFNNPVITVVSQNNAVDHGTAVSLDETAIAAYSTAPVIEYATVSGTKKGYNIEVGSQKVNVYSNADISAFEGKSVVATGYTIGWYAKNSCVNFVAVSVAEAAN